MTESTLIIVGLMPLLASGLICGIHWISRRREEIPSDALEKQTLALMILPVAIGAGFLLLARLAPSIMTAPSLPVDTGSEEGGWAGRQMLTFIPQVIKINWLVFALDGVAAVYAVIAAIAAIRLLLAQWRLMTITGGAKPLAGETDVHVTAAGTPAFAWRRSVILPERLITNLSAAQLAMVIAHERAHLSRGDAFYFALLSWVDVVFWFNPFIRHQTSRCRLAAELACDALIARANPEMRQVYAAALLLALKHSAGNALQCVPAVISPSNSGEFRMRLTEIMRATGAGRKRARWIAQIAAAALVLPLVAGQFMLSQNPARASMTATIAGVAVFSNVPVKGEIVSPYGPRTNPLDGKPQIHEGIDFRAAIGSPVYAAAGGQVVTVKTDSWNGLYMEVDHGGGYITRYTHLKKLTVADKATVAAGQQIAEVGNSGKSTGPHLHFAVFKDGKPIDPATVLPQLRADVSVTLAADSLSQSPDNVTVASGHVEIYLPDRTIRAEQATYDPKAQIVIADGKTIDVRGETPAAEF